MLLSAQKNRPKAITKILALLLAAGLIAYGAWGLWQYYRATHGPTPDIASETVTYSTDEPDEIPPNCDDYRVADDQPRKIELSRVNISGCIQKVGLDQHQAIAVPTNVHLAGWYVGSAVPGDKGISIIDGHVQGRYSDAIFGTLKDVRAGDIIRVQFGDMSWKEFETVDTNSYSVAETTRHLLGQLEDVDNQLTLITCTGTYDRQSQSYNQRILVRARHISE